MLARRAVGVVAIVGLWMIESVICGQGFDHQAHAVPGSSQTVYENPAGSGYALVRLDGSLSHSHYFAEGPPVVSGRIVSFLWRERDTGRVLGRKEKITVRIRVGVTVVELLVKDQTGDRSSASTTVKVVPADRVLKGAVMYFYDVPTRRQYATSRPRPFFTQWKRNVAIWNKNGLPAEFRGVTNGAIRTMTRFYPRRTGHYKFVIRYMGGDIKCWINGKLVAEGKTTKERQQKDLVFRHGTTDGKLLSFEILLVRKFFPIRLVLLNSAVRTPILPSTPLDVTNTLRLSFKPRNVVPTALYSSHSRSPIEGGQRFSIRASGLDGTGNLAVIFSCGGISKPMPIQRVDAANHAIIGLIPSFPRACTGGVRIKTQRKGDSNTLPFEFMRNGFQVFGGPGKRGVEPLATIRFQKTALKAGNGKAFKLPAGTSIAFGPDGRYYVGTLTGVVYVLRVDDRSLKVKGWCKSPRVADRGSILGLAFNPLETYDKNSARLYMSVSVLYHQTKKTGDRWWNGRILAWKSVDDSRCMVFDREVITGLPVSDRDHGVNAVTFDYSGRLFISVGSITNGGVRSDKFGDLPEGQLSAAVLMADLSKPGFNGAIRYNSKSIGTAKKVSGNVELFATGIRNSYGLTFHSIHGLYATDNGMNQGFGDTSTSCTTSTVTKQTQPDKLIRVKRGKWYGFPNRNRKECRLEDGRGALANMESSTTGVAEYSANTFGGRLRGQLILTKFAVRGSGVTTRVELTGDGERVARGPSKVEQLSGLAVVVGPRGELVMPQVQQSVVRVLKPSESGSGQGALRVTSVRPRAGRRRGGNVISVYGDGFGKRGKVAVGGKQCKVQEWTTGRIRCEAPAGSKRGHVDVVVTVRGGGESFAYDAEYFYA